MAFVRGETLTQRVERAGPLPPAQATRMFQELAWGLGYAHANGVIHRDVKPDNILLEQASGRAMIADFGVAFAADAGRQTGTGQIVGTPHYVSPEQAYGNPVDGRSDLYSLGASMFFALTGRTLFDGPSPLSVVTKHLNEPPPPVASLRKDLPRILTDAVDRCLIKEPSRRFATGEELAEALAATGLAEYEIPPPLRRYFRQGRGVALAWLMAFALTLWFWRWIEIPADPVSRTIGGILFGLAVLWPFYHLVRTARRALMSGLEFRDVKVAAALEARVLAEESKAVWGGEFSGELSRTREDWLRILAGPFGRLIFRLARIGLHGARAVPHPNSRPAERIVGAAAAELFQELPEEIRQRLSDLPDVNEELCCRAEEIREEPGPGQQEELARVIGALERVRLDLLRLQAGEASPEDVRAAVNAAAQVNVETGSRRTA
jgi:serine/threonine-protein kinase